jgi:hypothetical protein
MPGDGGRAAGGGRVRAYAVATLLLSATIAALGLTMLVLTVVRGGGAGGYLLGTLFLAAGLGRLYVQVRS